MRQLKIQQSITNRESDSLERYLRDISREEMITIDREVELAARIRKGDEEALEELTRANLRFVVSVAKRYQGMGLSLIDLINEGNMGMLKAARRFDETRGFKFISFAVSWIRQSILQALAENSRLVRLPLNQVGNVSRVNRFLERFVQTNERRPSTEEIAEGIGINPDRLDSTVISSGRQVSMDAPLVDNEENCLLDILPAGDSGDADELMNDESLRLEMERALRTLPDREASVLRLFYGLGTKEHSLEEIGTALHLSRERVRQIKEKALNSLRISSQLGQLRTYLG